MGPWLKSIRSSDSAHPGRNIHVGISKLRSPGLAATSALQPFRFATNTDPVGTNTGAGDWATRGHQFSLGLQTLGQKEVWGTQAWST